MRRRRETCDHRRVVTTDAAPPYRRLYRRTDGRVIAGVARGLADLLGFDVAVVRIVFVVLAAAGGSGLAMYAMFWVFAPLHPDEGDQPSRSRDLGLLVSLGAVTLGVLLLLPVLGIGLRPQTVL